MDNKANIKEIFTSIQGEGLYVGYKQLFVRFCGCNLNCDYCDTDYSKEGSQKYTADELARIVKKNADCHSVSLTGGESLLHAEFLKEFLPLSTLPVYLETNSTLPDRLEECIDYIDYVAADIKLPSCTGGEQIWHIHDKFMEIASSKDLFIKVVFDANITEDEIKQVASIAAKHRAELILQPKMNGNTLSVDNEFIYKILLRFLDKYKKVRVIPQTHKFLNLR